jgi:F-type H+-transporting ATPase subunit delta
MSPSPLVNRYAQAVFSMATEHGTQGRVVADLNAFESVLQESRELRECLLNPFIPGERKQAVIAALFVATFQPLTLNFLRMLIDKKRMPVLAEVTRRTSELLRQSQGILPVRLTSARMLTPGQTAAIRERLGRIFRRQVELDTTVNAELLGGIVIEADYRQIDGSCRGQLIAIQHALSNN